MGYLGSYEHGYNVKDVGASENYLDIANKHKITYVAIVEKVGTDGAWWDGVFDYSMRVVDVVKEKLYGQPALNMDKVVLPSPK